MNDTLSPDDFIRKWRHADLTERAGAQPHFLDLCRVLGEPGPAEADPDGLIYAFEKGAVKTTGRPGFADVWRKDRFAWEYKRPGSDLAAALAQLQQYALALDNPPVLIACDLRRFLVQTNFTATVNVQHRFDIADLADPATLALLKHAMADPEELRPGTTRRALTETVAREFAELARRLRARGHDPQAVAHFTHRLVFGMFAEGAGLLPAKLFTRMLHAARERPADAAQLAAELFGAMALPGGRVGYDNVAWFNGGLFDDDAALPLAREDVDLCLKAAAQDWQAIDPSIFGTLFERGLDPAKERLIGAHYTDRAKIDLIVGPVVLEPLHAEWEAVRVGAADRIAAADVALAAARTSGVVAEGQAPVRLKAKPSLPMDVEGVRNLSGTQRAAVKRAEDALAAARVEAARAQAAFLARLHAYRVLDPACGSGNFLYVALRGLKDLERRVAIDGETLGLNPIAPTLGPECVLGIEVNRFAAELARMSVWIGEIQWMLANGFTVSERRPILRALDTIECRDALLDGDGGRAAWPKADAIVGNPPFLGAKLMKRRLGVAETLAIRAAFPTLPGFTDLVCYWFDQALNSLRAHNTQRVGLVATNSIRKGTNLPILKRIADDARLFEAWSEERWVVEGANVDVSIVCFEARSERSLGIRLNGTTVTSINADLTSGLDLTRARTLRANGSGSYLGVQKSGPFDIEGDLARRWLREPTNLNRQTNSSVLKPYWNGDDLTGRPQDKWFIDLPIGLSEQAAALYQSPYKHLSTTPDEDGKLLTKLREELGDRAGPRWWEPHWPRPEMRSKVKSLQRYIATPETAQHRIFVWLSWPVLPDKNLIVFPRDDDTAFGVLHSRFHEAWALRKGSDLQDRPRYTLTTTFETFPFPEGLGPDTLAIAYADDPRARAIAHAAAALDRLRRAWLNPPELVQTVPEVVPGFPDRLLPVSPEAAATLKTRTLTNLYNQRPRWLADAHDTLDRAVAAAYGWPADIATEDALARLLELNLARAG